MMTRSEQGGRRRRAAWWLFGVVAMAVQAVVVPASSPVLAAVGPTIEVWYGDSQSFGQVGTPQGFVNIVGNVSDPDGVTSLSYSLNGGGWLPLSVGPDNRRLAASGDFNVDVPVGLLVEGVNTVEITAVDGVGDVSSRTMTVDYTGSNEWPLPYAVDWSGASGIGDVAQVVDGKWVITPAGLRTTEPGYDRLVAVGDMGWADYEVTVPITVHSIGEGGIYSGAPMVGVLMRWHGHTDDPWAGQPLAGYRPNGNIGIWRAGKLGWYSPSGRATFDHQLGVTYVWKLRVVTNADGSSTYSMKAWPSGSAEPGAWWRTVTENPDDLGSGSLLLLAHHMDVTFGDVNVTPVGGGSATVSVSSSVVGSGSVVLDPPGGSYSPGTAVTATAVPASGWEFVGWSGAVSGSANPVSFTVDANTSITATFSETSGEPVSVSSSVVGSGSVVLDPPGGSYSPGTTVTATAVPASGWEFVGWSGAVSGSANPVSFTVDANTSITATFSEVSAGPPAVVSDDFSGSGLDTDLWTVVDPVGDGSVSTDGSRLLLSVPAGSAHDAWGSNDALRVMQPAADADVEVEVKFESAVSTRFQSQGVLFEESPGNYVRFDVFGVNGEMKAFASSTVNGSSSTRAHVAAGSGGVQPVWVRVSRVGNAWTGSYSLDGVSYTQYASFSHAMTVTSAGPFAGNAGSSPPAFTAMVDYFFETGSPVVPDDDDPSTTHSVSSSVVGSGSVALDPPGGSYPAGAVVTATAMPGVGSEFVGWSGGVTGGQNPVSFTVEGDMSLTATFEQEPVDHYSVSSSVVGSGSVVLDPPGGSYAAGSVVSLSAQPEAGWVFAGWSSDLSGSDNPASITVDGDKSVTATFEPADAGNPTLRSDDFDGPGLDGELWTVVDPVGDGQATTDGSRLVLSVPAGSEHNAWASNTALRVMQPTADNDLRIEVKFDSSLTEPTQSQGVLVEESPGNYVRFDLYSNDGNLRAFASSTVNNKSKARANTAIGSVVDASLWLQVRRVGNTWTGSYSFDGVAFTDYVTFSHAMSVASSGPFAGNAGSPIPGFTARIDYYHDVS